jgi:serine/threonine-protein kinase
MSLPDPLLGSLVGSIRVTSRLGAGAMGVVYRGRHEVLGKDVALKVLGQVRGDMGHARQRFLREGQAAAKVAHPNVVQVFEAGMHQGQPYLVMELVIGHSLGSLLDEVARKHGRPAGLPPETVTRLGAGIALGIQAIHAAGVVHRDIKPDNVMVAADRTPKVADLGLAKEVAAPDELRLTGTGMVVGTPLYCAPEAIRNPQEIGPAADIYSLGATLYHMLTGKPPFDGDTAYAVMRAHLEDQPRNLREVVPGIPGSLAGLVELCMEKEPARRPSALQVAEALSGGATLKARQRLGLVGLIAVGCLAVGTGGATAWWFLRPQSTIEAPVTTTGSIQLQCLHPRLRARIDGGLWQTPRPEGLTVQPGRRTIEVEADQPGPLLRWSGEAMVPGSGQIQVAVELEPVPVPEVRLAMPGAGMLYLAGRAVGTEPTASVTMAGTWPLARWEGVLWRTRTWRVEVNGQANQLGQDGSFERPDGEARWRVADDQGQPVEAHHVICWWEAERVRKDAGLPEPAGWLEQALRPAQPALRLRADLVEVVLERLRPAAALPERTIATGFAARLRQPVWFRDARGQPALVGGGSGAIAGTLVVVPAAPPAAK